MSECTEGAAKAVIAGLAGRFPRSKNVQEFWKNLSEGKDMIGKTRWPVGLYGLPPRIGAINDIGKFDADYFNIPEYEANHLNPMLRHLLEVVYECVADSGLTLADLQENYTGFYLACFGSDTDPVETSRCPNTDHVSVSPFLAAEVMKIFSFAGPTATVDTACSSSMAVLDIAITDLLLDRCKFAIVAGSNLIISPNFSQQMMVLNMLSPQGQSQVFDAGADGYVRAEGVAAILLARRPSDCKRVYVNLVDMGVNTDGYKSAGITNPSRETQGILMKDIYSRIGIDPCTMPYVEAHGTGTQAGDTTETGSIADVFCTKRQEPLLVGSVKSNMGHSEATSGLASIIKCILALHHKELPPNRNYKVPNPKIEPIADGRMKVVDKNIPLPTSCKYIGINSFGFGGVNGHAVIQPYDGNRREEFEQVSRHILVPLTARTEDCVLAVKEFVSNNRYNTSLMALLSGSMLSCDQTQPIRGYIHVGPGESDWKMKTDVLEHEPSSMFLLVEDFMWDNLHIASDLLDVDCFRESVAQSAQLVSELGCSINLLDLVQNQVVVSTCTQTGMVLATALLLGLLDCLAAAGIPLYCVIGCGMSEVLAAYLDGCLSRRQCLAVAKAVGTVLEKFTESQSVEFQVYEVRLPCEDAYRLGPKVQVLSVLDGDLVVLSVETDHKDRVLQVIHDKGGYYRLLPVHLPLYSGYMEDVSREVKQHLQQILTEPKPRSVHMLSCHNPPLSSIGKATQLFDADYFSQLLSSPGNQSRTLHNIPKEGLVLRVCASCCNVGVESGVECIEGDQSTNRKMYDIRCCTSAESLCQTLGEMHMLGYEINAKIFYTTTFPLGIEAPCLSPLVRWNHSMSWNIPEWPEFSCRVKDEVEFSYILYDYDLEGIHTPLSLLLYHAWLAIAQRLKKPTDMMNLPAINLHDLVVPNDRYLTNQMLSGARIQVHPGKKRFIIVNENEILLSGSFEVPSTVSLPKIPGYDLDINENIELKSEDREEPLYKTEVMWEDSWLDFINAVVEFAVHYTDAPLTQLLVDPKHHNKEAKDCANFLTVFEKYTGVCKSGGCSLQFSVTSSPPESEIPTTLSIGDHDSITVSKVLVYNLHSNSDQVERIMVYLGEKMFQDVSTSLLGLALLQGGNRSYKEIPLPADWVEQDLDIFVPYVITAHILCDVAKAREGQTVLVCPPIDTTAVYLLSLANSLGCSVFTSTWDTETRQHLDQIFPFVRVLPGEKMEQNIKQLTQGSGVDLCVRCTGGDITKSMNCVAPGGQLIQCTSPPPQDVLHMGIFLRNKGVQILNPYDAFQSILKKSPEDLQALMYNLQGEAVAKLSMEGFPETKGVLYSQEEKAHFIQPIRLEKLLLLLNEPGLNTSVSDLMEVDAMAVARLQTIVAPRPKYYSISENSVLELGQDSPVESRPNLDLGMMMTPSAEQSQQVLGTPTPPPPSSPTGPGSILSPEVRVFHLSGISDISVGKPADTTSPISKKLLHPSSQKNFPPTSTPVIAVTEDVSDTGKRLDESYLDNQGTQKTDVPTIIVSVPQIPVIIEPDQGDKTDGREFETPPIAEPSTKYKHKDTPQVTPSTFGRIMQKKLKPIPAKLNLLKPRIDLLITAPPLTPLTSSLREVLTPCKLEPTLVRLNKFTVTKERPLFIVHPITGIIKLLEPLGELLSIPCFGIQRNAATPACSVPGVASYYRNSIEMQQKEGPYRIAGYSFGAIIALEIALQLQANDKEVECLILLDGSPDYVNMQIESVLKVLPANATSKQVEEAVEIGALINWISMFEAVEKKEVMYGWLRKLPTTEDRINTAVDLTMGSVIVRHKKLKYKPED